MIVLTGSFPFTRVNKILSVISTQIKYLAMFKSVSKYLENWYIYEACDIYAKFMLFLLAKH